MHPDNEPITISSGTLYIVDPDTGEKDPLGPVNDITETIVPDPISPNATNWVKKAPESQEASFTITPQFQKMSRKRFVKTLMGYRVSRNRANAVAKIARARGHSYGWALLVIKFIGFQLWVESQAMTCEEE